nr:phosphatidylinositol transfer protein SFH5-like [Quercus suber]POF16586.1 phosphatidylinositol transfer protein sfh5 [Quercus suber]
MRCTASSFKLPRKGVSEHRTKRSALGVDPLSSTPASHTTLLILQKFLRANAGDLGAAKVQLENALKWRKEYNPLAAKAEVFPRSKFGGLGYITTVHGAIETKNEADIATFNIYGAVGKDLKATFGDTDAFVRWRVALMELTLEALDLPSATKTIPDYGQGTNDPYQAIQIHDYQSVSFFRQPPEIRTSSQKIISLFQAYYPETVSYKYFVNVPIVMQWMMGAMKAFMSKDSIQKMTWMTYGTELHKYLGNDVAKEYGGSGRRLRETGKTVIYGSDGTSGTTDTAGAGASPPEVDAASPAPEVDSNGTTIVDYAMRRSTTKNT